jgi:hypothetical protein
MKFMIKSAFSMPSELYSLNLLISIGKFKLFEFLINEIKCPFLPQTTKVLVSLSGMLETPCLEVKRK